MKRFHASRRAFVRLCFLMLAVSLFVTGGVFAKYIQTVGEETLPVTAKAFYFTSNYLTENSNTYRLNPGTKSLVLELYNYENDLRVSETGCTYTVTVASKDTTVTVDGTVTAEKKITVTKDKTDTKITLGDLEDGYEYHVTVTADGGYLKVLSAVFEVAPAQNGLYMNVDETDEGYVLLTVWTENLSGAPEITVPIGLIPDATVPILSGIRNYTNGVYERFTFTDSEGFLNGYSSRAYRFFKASSYDSTQKFAVKMGDAVAIEGNIP